jgi:hypothetical protein
MSNLKDMALIKTVILLGLMRGKEIAKFSQQIVKGIYFLPGSVTDSEFYHSAQGKA